MVPRWTLGFALVCFALFLGSAVAPATALPMKPDIEQQLKRAAEPPMKYPVARVAWNGPESRKPFNPVYESMLYPLSAEALGDQLLRLAVPNTGVLASVFTIIFLLRMRRRERERMTPQQAKVVAMPAPARGAA
jgi:hypothetical protein